MPFLAIFYLRDFAGVRINICNLLPPEKRYLMQRICKRKTGSKFYLLVSLGLNKFLL